MPRLSHLHYILALMSPQKIKALRLLALFIPVLFLTACSKVSELGFPGGVSSVNDQSLPLWQGAWIAAGVIGVSTLILILWPAVFHRAKAQGPEFPKQTQYHIPVEIIYTIIPFIVVAVMFYYTAKKESVISQKTTIAAHEISVVGTQWSWQFAYPEAGPEAVVTGTPTKLPLLVVPLGELVRYTLTSNDVVHGFWIPAFMIQMQNLPGVTNHLEFTANKLGEFPGRCNILCGRAHSQMLFTLKVVTPTEYTAYLEGLKGSSA